MSVLFITTHGPFVIDLYHSVSPKESLNFMELCRHKFYNFQVFYNVNRDFIVQSGNAKYSDQSAAIGETSIWGLKEGQQLLVRSEGNDIPHSRRGLVSLVSSSSPGAGEFLVGSQFLITLSDERSSLQSLDKKAVVIGEIREGLEPILKLFNTAVVDDDKRPLSDIVILHSYVVSDPFDRELTSVFGEVPEEVLPTKDTLVNLRWASNSPQDNKTGADRQALELKSKELTLQMIGDLDNSIQPSEKVLFICKLNPVTRLADLEIIFQRFGKVTALEVIMDKVTGRSLNYGFIEFESKEACELLYLKMDNVLIDDRRVHVDFSQSISKEKRKRGGEEVRPSVKVGQGVKSGIKFGFKRNKK